MRLKSIALLVVAMLLLVGSAAGMAAAGAGDRSSDEGWRMNACYWWEDGLECLPPYQRKQVRDIMVLILDAYFGIDISRMSLEELDEVGSLIGNVGQEKVRSLFEHYAHKKGFEMPEPPEPSAPLPIEPVYWWEITCPQGALRAIIYQVAQAKGKGMCRNEVEEMCPSEVEERFGELFPDMDIWNMTFDEFILFLNSLPRVRAPLRPVCFEELQHNPRIIALFGRVPPLSTEQELEKFNEKLEEVIEAALPLLGKLPRCEFPLGLIIALHGAISIAVCSDQLPRAEEVYQIIAEKAESLFGIKDVPVTFNRATKLDGPAAGPAIRNADPQGSLSNPPLPLAGGLPSTNPSIPYLGQ